MKDLLKTAHKLIKNVSDKHKGEWAIDKERLEDLRVALGALIALSEESGTYDWDIDVLDDRTIFVYFDMDLIDTNVHNSYLATIMNKALSLKICATPGVAGESRMCFVFPPIWKIIQEDY